MKLKPIMAGLALAITAIAAQANHHGIIVTLCQDVPNHTVRPLEVVIVEQKTGNEILRWPWAKVRNNLKDWASKHVPDWEVHPAPIVPVARGRCPQRQQS